LKDLAAVVAKPEAGFTVLLQRILLFAFPGRSLRTGFSEPHDVVDSPLTGVREPPAVGLAAVDLA
jgi:hypothetical protein